MRILYNKTFGAIFFCQGVDVLISLSWALGMLDTAENYGESVTKHLLTSILNDHAIYIVTEKIVA